MSRDGHAPNKKNVCFHTTMSKAWALSKQKINVCFHYAMPRGGHAPNKKSRFASTMQCPGVGMLQTKKFVCFLFLFGAKASLFLRFLLFYFFIISIFTLLYVLKHNFYSFSLFICSFGCVYKCSNFVTILYPLSS